MRRDLEERIIFNFEIFRDNDDNLSGTYRLYAQNLSAQFEFFEISIPILKRPY